MSRVNPFLSDPLQGFLGGNPFAGLGISNRQQTVSDMLPQLSPADEQSSLGRLMESSLGGLAYLGKVADKTFGARAIRGVLGGVPQELLSAIPLSDTLGITQESNTVTGRKLLENAGLVGQGDPNSFDLGDLAGFGAEMALDPSTYLGIGPLTKAGQIAKKAGGLPATSAARAAGFAARESELAPIAAASGRQISDLLRDVGAGNRAPVLSSAAEAAAQAAGVPINTTFGLNQSGQLARNADAATPLSAALGFGLPFQTPSYLIGEGKTLGQLPGISHALGALGSADEAIKSRLGFSPGSVAGAVAEPAGRFLSGAFSPDLKGTYDPRAQEIARDVISPLERSRGVEAKGKRFDALRELAPFLGRDDKALMSGLQSFAEGVGDVPLALQGAGQSIKQADVVERRLAQHFDPQEIDQLRTIAEGWQQHLQGLQDASAAKGVRSPELDDSMIDYFTRSKNSLPRKPNESLFTYQNRIGQEYAANHASQIQREPFLTDIPGGTTQLNDWSANRALSGPQRTMTDAQVKAHIYEELTGLTRPGGPDDATWKQAGKLSNWLKELPETHAAEGVPFFSPDLPNNLLTRMNRSSRADTAADALMESAVRFGDTKQAIEAAGDKAVPVMDAFKDFGLTEKSPQGGRVAPKILADRLGITAAQVKALHIPESMLIDLKRVNEAWQNPKALSPVIQAWDYASNLFKGLVTKPFPSFHSRNLASGMFNMWRGGLDNISELKAAGGEAYNLVRGQGISKALPGMSATSAADATTELLREMTSHDVAFTTHGTSAADLAGPAGTVLLRRPELPMSSGNTPLQDIGAWVKGAIPGKGTSNPLDLEKFAPVAAGNKVAETSENWLRSTHYIGLRQKGFAPAEAAAQVKKYQIDYGNLAPIEQNVMKRIFPWYSFSRRNIAGLGADLAEQPGKITQPLRAATQLRTPNEFIPGYVAEGASVPIPGGPDNEQRYITGFGLPFEDEWVKTLGSLAHGDLQRTAQSILGNTQPAIKAPLEFTFDKQLYSGRPLEDLKPYELASFGGLLDDQTARILTQIGANTPASRALSTTNKLLDARKGVGTDLTNLLTGVRISDVDVERARDAAAKQTLGDLLRGQPGVKTTSDVYIPRDRIPSLPEDELTAYRLYLNADQRQRDKAARRKLEFAGLPGQ